MKRNKLTITILALCLSCWLAGFLPAQISIPPAKGDRASYYLINSEWGEGGLVWVTDFDYSSPVILKSFRDTEVESYWIQKLNMKTSEFEKLMEYLKKNDIGIYGTTREAKQGSDDYQLSAFDIDCPDVNKVKDTIKKYIKGKSKPKSEIIQIETSEEK